MLKDILHSLSDTELIVISNEIINPAISNFSIYNQLISKSNDDTTINTDDFTKLPNLVINELANRLLDSNKQTTI